MQNGDTSSAAALVAAPGPDGISLREAVEATNNDPGRFTIRFAPALRGRTLTLRFGTLFLTGGGVTLTGDVDGDGKPDVTLRPLVRAWGGIHIASSGNRLRSLVLDGFAVAVSLQPIGKGDTVPSPRQSYADNAISGLVIRRARDGGIVLQSAGRPDCGVPRAKRCLTYDRWAQTTISGNTVESGHVGIKVHLGNVGDRFEHAAVTGNTVRILGRGDDAGIAFEVGVDSQQARIADVLIARNSVRGSVDIGINVNAGTNRGQRGTIENVRILDNRVSLSGPGFRFGIAAQAGSEAPSHTKVPGLPPRYPDGNLLRNVVVRGNTVTGALVWGVTVNAGIGAGGSWNRVQDVRVERNVIRSGSRSTGVFVWTGLGLPYGSRTATGNRIAGLTIASNRIAVGGGGGPQAVLPAGIGLLSGGRASLIRDVRVKGNRVAVAAGGYEAGIRIVTEVGNAIRCLRLAANSVTGVRPAVSGSASGC